MHTQSANRNRAWRGCTMAIGVAFAMSLPQIATAQKAVQYRLGPGQMAGYALRIEINSAQSSEFFGGVACFWGDPPTSKAVKARTKDNLQKSQSAAGLRFTFPSSGKMLDKHFAVNKYGEPLTSVNGKLPMLLGDLEEIFFPPLPKDGKVRSKTDNVYHRGDGDFRFFGSPPVPEGNKGKFIWSTTYVSKRGNVMQYVHRRKFATNDQRYQLMVQGPIEFDAATGTLLSQKLQGYCVDDGKAANFSIMVTKLSRNEMTKLVSLTSGRTP